MDGAYRPGRGGPEVPHILETASSRQGHISIKRNCGPFRKKSCQPSQGQAFISPGGEKQLGPCQGEPHVYASALPICWAVTSQPASRELWNLREVASGGMGDQGQSLMGLNLRRVGSLGGVLLPRGAASALL